MAQVSGALFSSLLAEEGWLVDLKVSEPGVVKRAWQAQQLFALRRAAGAVLARLERAEASGDEPARARFVAIMSRALGVKLIEEDGVRMRLETDDFLRAATQLRSMLLAASLRQRLGDGWWRTPASGQALLTLWAKGTELPAETLLGSLMQAVPQVTPPRTERPGDGGVVQPPLRPERLADAGVE